MNTPSRCHGQRSDAFHRLSVAMKPKFTIAGPLSRRCRLSVATRRQIRKPFKDRRRERRCPVIDHLGYDLTELILSRLPYRSVLNFSLASRPLMSYFKSRVLPRWLPHTVAGFVYHPHRIHHLPTEAPKINGHRETPGSVLFASEIAGAGDDLCIPTSAPASSDLLEGFGIPFPASDETVKIVDCCNGLLLGSHGCIYFMLNPVTKRKRMIPMLLQYKCLAMFLAFDPRLSPHFQLLSLKKCRPGGRSDQFMVYSSETNKWGKASELADVPRLPDREQRHAAYWNGDLYVAGCDNIIRFLLREGKSISIAFPDGAKSPGIKATFGPLVRNFCYADIHGLRLRVWVYEDLEGAGNWKLETNTKIKGAIRAQGLHGRCKPHVLAFHPHSEAIYLLLRSKVYSYDIGSGALALVCKLATEEFKVLTAKVFPFSRCSIDTLCKQKEMKVQVTRKSNVGPR